MKKIFFQTLLLLVFSFSAGYAAPTVQNYSGSVDNDKRIVITGSGFGTRANNGSGQAYLCRLYEDFEKQSFDQWMFTVNGASWRTTTENARPGSRYVAHKRNSDPLDRLQMRPDNQSEYYVAFWMYTASNMPTTNNNKYFRAGSTASNANLVLNSNSNSANMQMTVEFASGGTQVDYGSQSVNNLKGRWNLVEIHWALPVLGSSKDFAKVWVNGSLVNSLPSGAALWPKGETMTKSPYIAIGAWYATAGGIGDGWYFDNVYIDYTPARVMIGNASTFQASTKRELQPPVSWSNNGIEVVVKTGAFNTGEKAYLYVVDANGNASGGLPVTIGGTGSGSGAIDPGDPQPDSPNNLRTVSVR